MEPIIKLVGIKKKFDNKEVLKNINIDINKGEVACLIGKSGSGKTTLLRCLNLLEIPNEGSMKINDATIQFNDNHKNTKSAIKAIREHSGMVFQSFNLFPHKTVMENIIEAPVIVKKANKKDTIKKAKLVLKKVGLEDFESNYPSSLSGGQQQRAAIARALMMEPDIILFDEPTSALDPTLVREVLNVIKNLSNENQTMVIVTHEMNFAYEVADKIYFLNNGQVEESGTPDEIFGNPKSESLKEFLIDLNETK